MTFIGIDIIFISGCRGVEHQNEELERPSDGRAVSSERHHRNSGSAKLLKVQPQHVPPSQEQPQS